MAMRGAVRTSGRPLLWAMLLTLPLWPSSSLFADARDDYKAALEAIGKSQWQDAERLLRSAISQREKESFTPVFNRQYTPHYSLGVVLQEVGDCRGALAAWAESEQQGKIQRTDDAEDLGRRRQSCEDLIQQVDDARVDAEDGLDRARQALERVEKLALKKEIAAVWAVGTPSWRSRQGQAERKLTEASKGIESASRALDLAAIEVAAGLAAEAGRELDGIATEARKRLGEVNEATAQALGRLGKAEDAARGILRSVASLAPYPPRLGRKVSELKTLLADIDAKQDSASASDLESASNQLAQVTGALKRLAEPPPVALSEAAQAYLEGRYPDVLAQLEDANLRGARARFHGQMLKAAARHAEYLLGGGRDPELLDLAAEDVRAALAFDPLPGNLSETYFPPSFRKLWQEELAAAEAAAAEAEDADEAAEAVDGEGGA
ncbi:MAG: hypothetical protein AAGD06_25065 [Acidobacteriota bacterium]